MTSSPTDITRVILLKCKSVPSQLLEYNLRTISNRAMFRLINVLLQFWTDGEDGAALLAFFPQWNDKKADLHKATSAIDLRLRLQHIYSSAFDITTELGYFTSSVHLQYGDEIFF